MKNIQKKLGLLMVVVFLTALVVQPVSASFNLKDQSNLGLGVSANVRLGLNNKDKADKEKGEEVKQEKQDDIEQDDDRLPPGIQKAPGITKRIDEGKNLPKGLLQQILALFGFAKPDKEKEDKPPKDESNLSLKIGDIKVDKVGTSTASIVWRTNIESTGSVRYGTTTNLTATSTTISDNVLKTNHEVRLDGLLSNTTYYFMVTAKDKDGNVVESNVRKFETRVVDQVAPNIVFVTSVGTTATSTRIVWVSNEASDSKLWVSTSTPVNISGTPTASSTNLSLYHELVVTGLVPSTQYFYSVSSTDVSENTAVAIGNGFVTPN